MVEPSSRLSAPGESIINHLYDHARILLEMRREPSEPLKTCCSCHIFVVVNKINYRPVDAAVSSIYYFQTGNIYGFFAGMAKLLLSLEGGLHLSDDPYTTCATVAAFRLEPDPSSPPGIMTVDGESIDYGSLQAQVLPSMARVMSIRQRDNWRRRHIQ